MIMLWIGTYFSNFFKFQIVTVWVLYWFNWFFFYFLSFLFVLSIHNVLGRNAHKSTYNNNISKKSVHDIWHLPSFMAFILMMHFMAKWNFFPGALHLKTGSSMIFSRLSSFKIIWLMSSNPISFLGGGMEIFLVHATGLARFYGYQMNDGHRFELDYEVYERLDG